MRYYKLYVDGQDNAYTYCDLENNYEIGEWVLVDFNRREKAALILEEDNAKEFEFKVSPIKNKVKGYFELPKKLIELYIWIHKYYLAKYKDIITAVYPKDLKISYKEKYCFVNPIIPMNEKEKEFLDYMSNKKEITPLTLKKHFDKELINMFLKKGVISLKKELDFKTKFNNKNHVIVLKNNTKLTEEQNFVKDGIITGKKRINLIKGVTGSGKTEVYIELIKDAVRSKQGVIVLLPEIALTPQMVKRFREEFGESLALLHSRLTQSQRANEWFSIYSGDKTIVLGVRSAVFAPVKNLKYIIMDEEHETTYKQDTSPRYHAKFVAIKRCELEDAKLILGSATPAIETYYYAKQGVFSLFELNHRFNEAKMPKLEAVDMKNEENDNFSLKLLQEIAIRLRKKEQVLIFLNKKGYSSFIQCKDCGHIEKCPHCSVTLSYYKYDGKLKCSYCGFTKDYAEKCVKCSSKNLKYYGSGTEKIEIELQGYFPEARILRVDSETVKDRESYSRIYKNFLDKKYDIMLGTQIISKGFHFPEITLVGIISADSMLNFPDFRAGEKTFQMTLQAAGRSGRGDKKGEVLIQTYMTDHYVLEKVLNDDYEGFYNEEIELREELKYPPFGRIINIVLSSEAELKLKDYVFEFYKLIEEENLEIYGPFPAPIYRIQKRYRYQIFIKGTREEINEFKIKLRKVMEKTEADIRVAVDVDPVNLM